MHGLKLFIFSAQPSQITIIQFILHIFHKELAKSDLQNWHRHHGQLWCVRMCQISPQAKQFVLENSSKEVRDKGWHR